jgi:lipopolysaccharide export system permease protein
MRTLHLYLTRQVFLTLLMTVTVFTFVILLTNLLKEILALLVNHQATLGIVLQAIGLLIPFVLAFALPMAMLTAALLVFGRFSADQELTAARASGLSLMSLITPVLLLSVALSIVCGLFNLEIAPRCRGAYKRLLYHMGFEESTSFLQEGRFVDFPGWVVYTRKRDGNHLQDIKMYGIENQKSKRMISASEGVVTIDKAHRKLHFDLTNYSELDEMPAKLHSTETEDTNAPAPAPAPAPATNEAVKLIWEPHFASEQEVDVTFPQTTEDKPRLSDMSFHQLRAEIRQRERQGIDATPALVQLHRQVAFSFASLGFTLIGIPLGVRAHRRETTAGIAMALLLVLVYYSFIILAQSWETHSDLAPHLIVWLPNFLFQAVGAVLLARANRGV